MRPLWYAVCLREPNPQSQSPGVPESARCVPLPLLAAPVSRPSRVHRVHSRLQSGCQCLRVPESTSYVLTPTECRCHLLRDSAIPPRSPENSDRLRPPTLASLLVAACAPPRVRAVATFLSQGPGSSSRPNKPGTPRALTESPAAAAQPRPGRPRHKGPPARALDPEAPDRGVGAPGWPRSLRRVPRQQREPAPHRRGARSPAERSVAAASPSAARPAAHLVALVSLQRPDRRLGELHMQHRDVVLPQPPARQPVPLLLPQSRSPPRRHLKLPGVPPRTPLGLQPPLRPRLLGLLQPPPQLRPSRC